MGRIRTGRRACRVRKARADEIRTGKRKLGTWIVEWPDTAGRRRERGGFPTKHAGDDFLDTLKGTGQTCHKPDATKVTVAMLAEQFFAHRQVRPSTNQNDRNRFRLHIAPEIGTLTLSEFTAEHARGYLHKRADEGASQATRNRELAFISAILSYALSVGLVARHATRGIVKQVRTPRSPRRVLTAFERRLLLDACREVDTTLPRPYLHMAVRIPLATALRPGPGRGGVLSLRCDQVDLQHRVFALPDSKTGKTLTVPFGEQLAHELAGHLEALPPGEPYLFPSRTPGVPHLTTIKKPFKKALELAGLPRMRYYDLRHVAITAWLDAGVRIHVVARIAGHASITTTQQYAHTTDLAERAAAEHLDADETAIERPARFKKKETG